MTKLIIALVLLGSIANAQKLPARQLVSVKAPADIKIDGKANEWDNKFQAYNNATDVFYTISNSDTELYLTVYCIQAPVIRRIMNAGLSLTISKSGKKNDPAAAVVTYPVFDPTNRFIAEFKEAPPLQVVQGGPPMPRVDQVRFPPPGGGGFVETLTKPVSDSLVAINNTKIATRAKSIRVAGVKGLDSLISVYNNEGIRAVGQFDKIMAYTYELSISLKNLGLSVNDAAKFAYQVKINEVIQRGIRIIPNKTGDGGEVIPSPGAVAGQPATDFWGEYTLKK